jgi:hypothetical protein
MKMRIYNQVEICNSFFLWKLTIFDIILSFSGNQKKKFKNPNHIACRCKLIIFMKAHGKSLD